MRIRNGRWFVKHKCLRQNIPEFVFVESCKFLCDRLDIKAGQSCCHLEKALYVKILLFITFQRSHYHQITQDL